MRLMVTMRIAYGRDERRETMQLHRSLPFSALSERMLSAIVNRKRGRRKNVKATSPKTATSKKNGLVKCGHDKDVEGSSRTLCETNSNGREITEFFPVLRRSKRKTEKQLEIEGRLAMEEAVLKGSNEDDLEIFETEVKGRGIRTLRKFSKNDFVVEYKGEIIDKSIAKKREKEYAKDESIGSFMYYFNYKDKQFCVDATEETVYKGRLINHSAMKPNLKTKVIEVDGQKHMVLIAKRNIEVGEELLYDYGDRTACTVAKNPWLLNS